MLLRSHYLPLPLSIALLLAACSGSTQSTAPDQIPDPSIETARPGPPVADRDPFVQEVNGVTWTDDYYWLRDRENPEVIAYLEAENAYTEAMMAHTEPLQEQLFDEMVGRIQETDLSVPYRDGDYYYYTRTEEGLEYDIHCRREGDLEAPEEVLLDENELAEGFDYFALGIAEMSPDHETLAYGIDVTGDELHNVRFRDVSTGEDVDVVLPGVYYGFAWANDGETVYYTTIDEAHRPHQLWRYQIGDEPDDAELIHTEDDERFFMSIGRSRSDAFVLMALDSALTSEWWVLDADDPSAEPRVVAERTQGVEYSVAHHGDRFFIRTNAPATEGQEAFNFRLVSAPVATPGREHWTEMIGHRRDVMLRSISAFAGHLVLREREGGLPQVRVVDLAEASAGSDLLDASHTLELPEPTYRVYLATNVEFDTTTVRYGYESLTTPEQVWDYDMVTRERELLKQRPVLGDYSPDDYVAERLMATAEDGTQVPISLVRGRGVEGPAPMLLTGYGSYGYPYDVYFSSNRLSLLDRGVVVAIGHIRGGGEMGRPWYEDGKLLSKVNTFTDFIAVAEHLIAEGYTSSDELAILGGSAGGLLMGAVTNMRPDLFEVVVADVPFVDVITTMLDESIPLTVTEWEEWGNPNDPEYFEYMRSYSPYDNVGPTDYPHMLVTAGLNDPRVGFWEPAKWVARMRAVGTGDNWLLLRTNMGAGHFGASGRYGRIAEVALIYGFILDRLGVVSPQM